MGSDKTGKKYDWPRILGFIGVTLSLIFVGVELQLSRMATEMEYSGDSSNRSLEYRAALAEHSEVWVRGCLGQELSPAEDFVFNSLAIAFMIEIQDSISRMNTLGDSDSVTFFVDLAAINIVRYPGIGRAFRDLSDWENLSSQRKLFNPELVEVVQARIRELEDSGETAPGNPNFCGVVW